ncbi:MAG: uracil-DNA glycosylase [Candidatus Competibacteraceae bacterium]|nr:uracil-DNA glycosylase [Candidatus Competibacteraceae bacterium]MBK7984101.1 uracil-DNA glycosylase [Candidatus Competibacteraceae bacterium]MBK8896077.1 uracil-DNA glycosylase [Candidatus Competibacteraceae bacterium]MBK8963508.1 uracil-DNA glycosylase [Candidatus Competibacteraceae bacterium]MBK9950401.1 uracil-DNA glycosylase [Candidatus Competibacteraceae bacterium]
MDEELRRRYLDALGIPLWLPRQPLAKQQAPSGAAVDPPPAVEADRATDSEPVTDESLADDDERALMDDDWGLSSEAGAGERAATPPADESREARIAHLEWSDLQATVRQCTACGLCHSRTQTVFGVGDRQAEWLVIGEAPGADEDRQGEPFVGRAGKLLNPMLQAIGLQREQVFITNILKCRPPENRDPTPAEAASCRPFLERQLALIQPRIILAVGRIAAQNLLNTDVPIGKLRSRIHHVGPEQLPLVVTYHPAYLLRSPREKRKAWDDLRLARRALSLPLKAT